MKITSMNRRQFLHSSLATGTLTASGLWLSGCGSGSKSLLLPNSSDANSSGDRSIIVTIVWPQRNTSRLIPEAAQSITLEVEVVGGAKVTAKTIDRPQATGSVSTPVKLDKLPAGNLVLTATALGSNSIAQAKGQKLFTTQVGTPSRTTVTMETTIVKIEIKPEDPSILPTNIEVAEGGTVKLVAEAKDADGAVVMVAPGKVKWTSSDPSIASVDPSGLTVTVTGKKQGSSVNLEVVDEESGKRGSTQVKVGADIQTYVDRQSWLAATNGVDLNYDFEGLPRAFQTETMSFTPGLTVSLSGQGFERGRGTYVNWWNFGNGSTILTGPHDRTRVTTFFLSSLVTALGSEIRFFLSQWKPDPMTSAGTLKVTLLNGTNQVGETVTVSVAGFFGITSSKPFDSVQIDGNATLIDGYLGFDDISMGSKK